MGLAFNHFNAHDMLHTIRRALSYYDQKEVWNELIQNAMNMNYSWSQSAINMNNLYRGLVSRSEEYVLK